MSKPPEPLVVRWRRGFLSADGPPDSMTRMVLTYLSTAMQADGSRCFESTGFIADRLLIDRRTVQRHIQKAAKLGWLDVVQRKTDLYGRTPLGGKVNQYFPMIPNRVAAVRRNPNSTGSKVDGTSQDDGSGGVPPLEQESGVAGGTDAPAGGSESPPYGAGAPPYGSVPPYLAVTGVDLAFTGKAGAHAQQNGNGSGVTLDAPSDWPVPDDFRDGRILYAALNDNERAFAFQAAGESNVPLSALIKHNDASPLPDRFYRELAYRVVTRRRAEVCSA